MDLLEQTVASVEGLLGHGDAPARISLPLAAWAATVASDAMASATGFSGFDAASRLAIGAGLVGSAGAMASGLAERRSEGVAVEGHEAAVGAHAAGALAVGGLFAASLLLRLGGRTPALARGLALAGAGLAFGNAYLTRRLAENARRADQHGRARLDPDSPLGVHRPSEAGA